MGATGDEYAAILARYGKIHTIAGLGALDSYGGNDWLESYEGGPAWAAELSEAHNAQADVFGLEVRWSSAWDGGALQRTDDLSAPEWFPVLMVAAVRGENRWSDPAWQRHSQSYFRFVPVFGWAAP